MAKTLTKTSLVGSVPVKSEMLDGNFYSLICLSKDDFFQSFDGTQQISKEMQEELQKQAQKGFVLSD